MITIDDETPTVKRIVVEGSHGKITITVEEDEGFPVVGISSEPDAEHYPYISVENQTGDTSFNLELQEPHQRFYVSFIPR